MALHNQFSTVVQHTADSGLFTKIDCRKIDEMIVEYITFDEPALYCEMLVI
jgi:hypothetical protein